MFTFYLNINAFFRHCPPQANMTSQDAPGLDLDLHNALVSVSCDMLTSIQSVLRPTPMDGRHHYLFTLKDITKCFQVGAEYYHLHVVIWSLNKFISAVFFDEICLP